MKGLVKAILVMLVVVAAASFLLMSSIDYNPLPADGSHPLHPGSHHGGRSVPNPWVAEAGLGDDEGEEETDDKQRDLEDAEEDTEDGAEAENDDEKAVIIDKPPYKDEDGREHAHIIFSTDCGGFQNWQSELLAFSADRVGHVGPITRIASGCSEEEKATLTKRYESLELGELRIHFAEASGKMKGGVHYKYFNKPSGLKHWLEHDKRIQGNEVIALLDPDMILMKPFYAHVEMEEHQLRTLSNGFWTKNNAPERTSDGHPVAANYGLGSKWLSFNREYVCGSEDSPCVTEWDLGEHKRAVAQFAVGPPYVATRNDFLKIADSWTEFCPKLYEEYAGLLTEMYAYCLAAVHRQLPHYMITNWMVSEPGMEDREAWPEVDAIVAADDFACDSSILKVHERHPSPALLHYCQRYVTATMQIWSKHRIPHDIFTCQQQLLKVPPRDVLHMQPGNDASGNPFKPKVYRRNVFMACYAIHAMNDALERFKFFNCDHTTPNMEQTYLTLVHGEDCKGDPNCHN